MRRERARLVRLRHYADRQELFRVSGEYVSADPSIDVSIDMGEVGPRLAWWDLPLPPCPDCGGGLGWAEAGLVPGARACSACFSEFSVESKS